MNYSKLVDIEEKENIAIDFDGVIHSCHLGFHDGTIYGYPIPGSIDAIKKIATKYSIIIYTAKAKQDRPLIDGKTGIQLVREWLDKHGILEHISHITAEKPRCICYIDDKAIRFQTWDQTVTDLNNLYNVKMN